MAVQSSTLLYKTLLVLFAVLCILRPIHSSISVSLISSNVSQSTTLLRLGSALGGSGHLINYTSSAQLSPRTCPSDLFSINSGNLVALGTIPSQILQGSPRCIASQNLIVVHSYECIVEYRIGGILKAESVIFNVLPSLDSASFPSRTWSGLVEEESTGSLVGGLAGLVASSPSESTFSVFSYQLSPPNSNFTIVTETHGCVSIPILKTTRKLDAESVSLYDLTVEAVHTVYENVRTTANVTVRVVDVNDNHPTFSTLQTEYTIYSNASIGAVLVTVEATDADSGLNSQLQYYIKTPQSYFTTNPLSGDVLVSGNLNSLSASWFNLTVVARDKGQPPKTAELPITIFIKQATMRPPSVNLTSSEASIVEHAASGTAVTTFTVLTQTVDTPTVELVGYASQLFATSLVSESELSHVYELRVAGDLDREVYNYGVRVIVEVKDGQNPVFTTSTNFLVTLNDTDDNAPVFDQSIYYVTVYEGTDEGVDVLSAIVTDRDIGQNAEALFSLSNSLYFEASSVSGALQTKQTLPKGSLGSHVLSLTAMGQGANRHNTTVMIHVEVEGFNFHQPTFQHPSPLSSIPLTTYQPAESVSVPETLRSDEVIYTFAASDPDSGCGGHVTYSITHASPSVVQIDGFTGRLYPKVDGALDYDTFRFVYVTVQATDNGIPFRLHSESHLQINITGANDLAPVMDEIQCPCFLREGTTDQQSCDVQLSASDGDVDENTQIVYRIVGGNERGHFTINTETGVVSTVNAARLDREIIDQYSLLLSASDGLHSSNNVTLDIIVQDQDDTTISYPTGTIRLGVPSNSKLGSTVASLAVATNDVGYNGLVTYTTSGSFPTVLYLDPNTGDLVAVGTLSRGIVYTFRVHVQDRRSSRNLQADVVVTITAPTLSPPNFSLRKAMRTIPQNLQTGSTVMTVSATLDNAIASTNSIVYSSEDLPSVFNLHDTRGTLSLAQSLSAVPSSYTFTVNASISGFASYSSQQTIEITVYTPSTASGSATLTQPQGGYVCHYSGTVQEAHNSRVSVVQLDSTRGGESLSYQIEQSSHSSVFVINGNNLDVNSGFASLLDLEQRDALYLTLTVFQGSSSFFRCAATVRILDTNNHAPLFPSTQYSVEMYSNAPVGSSVIRLQAMDKDSGSNAVTRYTLQSPSSLFSVDESVGILKLSQLLSSQSSTEFSVGVVATDSLSTALTSTTVVTVTVLALSNTAPLLSSLQVQTVSEDANVHHTIVSLPSSNTIDGDSGSHGKLKYCFLRGNIGGHFSISDSGHVMVAKSLNYEGPRQTFLLQLLIYDTSPNTRYATTSLSISVTNANENPSFHSSIYMAVVSEDAPSLAHVVTVRANDPDENDVITYSFVSGNAQQHFTIDSQTGDIYVSESTSLDRESVSQYVLTVVATDFGFLTGRTTVTIDVQDVNDSPPGFPSKVGLLRIIESTAPGAIVHTVSGADKDEGVNAYLGYKITSGNEDGLFSLNWETGQLKLLKEVDYEDVDSILRISLVAVDLVDLSQSSTPCQLTVHITDANDNPPLFSQQVYFATVRESAAMETDVIQIEASDADRDLNTITYALRGKGASDFAISSSGMIQTADLLDRETVSMYSLQVLASDAGLPRWTSTAVVQITVEDENDHLPDLESSYTLRLMEDQPLNIPFYIVRADDADVGVNAACTYSIESGNLNIFGIHSHSGFLYLKRELDYESAQSHSIVVVATNTQTPSHSDRATVTIEVADVDENASPPLFLPNSTLTASVAGDSHAGMFVARFTARDSDLERDGRVVYSLQGGSGVVYFDINSVSGILTVSSNLSASLLPSLTLHIEAEDSSLSPQLSNMQLLVSVPMSTIPVYFTAPIYRYSVREGVPAGTYVGLVSITGDVVDSGVRFSIVRGNSGSVFAVNATTGIITVAGSVDRESDDLYQLELTASNSHFSSHSLVSITILDSNDHRPSFLPSNTYSIRVFNNFYDVRPTVSVLRVLARDLDEPVSNGKVSYSESSPGASGMFSVSSTGEVSVSSSLSSSSAGPHSVLIVASDQGLGRLDRTGTVQITIVSPTGPSVAPAFSSSPESISVAESAQVGTEVVYTSRATDGNSAHLMYRILDSSSPSTTSQQHFTIHPNTGAIYVAGHLDREVTTEYTLRIEAWDGTSSDTLELVVSVTDVNDNSPKFSLSHYTFAVIEGIMTSVCCVAVSDRDVGVNGNVTMAIIDSTGPEGVFSISASGVVMINEPLDRETASKHTLTISGEDGGSPSLLSYCRVTIKVSDINDNRPIFSKSSYRVTVNETTSVETPVLALSASDPDSGTNGQVLYSLQPPSSVFSINASTGVLSLSEQLSFSANPLHQITVVATDEGLPTMSTSAVVTVQVLSDFTSPPLISQPSGVSVVENLPSNTLVTSVEADNVLPVFYTLTGGSGYFWADSRSGVVRTSATLDRESNATYTLTATAHYAVGFGASSSVSFSVTISDVNDNAPGPAVSSGQVELSVPESSSLSTTLFTLQLTDNDDDPNDVVNSVAILDPLASRNLQIDANGRGSLRMGSLDVEHGFSYQDFVIAVTDDGTVPQMGIHHIHLSVEEINDENPVFSSQSYSAILWTPARSGTSVTHVSATDTDSGSGGDVGFSLVGGNGTTTFNVDSTSGDITLSNPYRLHSHYHLQVSASDRGTPLLSSTADVYINVRNCPILNFRFDPSEFSLSLAENAETNTVILTPTLIHTGYSDSDIRFHLISNNDGVFAVDENSGNISLQTALDRETADRHGLAIQATHRSEGSLIADLSVEVVVEDVNDNHPYFTNTPYRAYISNDANVSDPVLRVSARDPDLFEGSQITYHITSGGLGFFSLDEITGELSVQLPLSSLQTGRNINLTVEARDRGLPEALTNTTIVSIFLVDSRAPSFEKTLYRANVSELAEVGDLVTTVKATVRSASGFPTYTIESGNDQIQFSVDFLNGEVTVARPLDYEDESTYRLELKVSDPTLDQSSFSLTTLIVSILDENDHTPVFSSRIYPKVLPEDADPGTPVTTVMATDADSQNSPNSEITYRFAAGFTFSDTFEIDPDSGLVSVKGETDYESSPIYEIPVVAVDGGSPQLTGTATVRLSVTNVNDNAPQFSSNLLELSVQETAHNGSIVGSVSANDRDADSISYKLSEEEGEGLFAIDAQTGEVRLVVLAENALTEPAYNLTVIASDGTFSSTATLRITVLDINDNPPMFTFSLYNGSVSENAGSPVRILQVSAIDVDRGGAALTYHLEENNRNPFEVETNTGWISTTSTSIDREENPSFEFNVFVSDGVFTSNTVVRVKVLDLNDNDPSFIRGRNPQISEDLETGLTVSTIEATDPDDGENGTLTYTIGSIIIPSGLSSTALPFYFGGNSGELILRASLNFESIPHYMFNVMIADGGNPPRSITVSYTIEIIDADDSPPSFTQSSYSFTMIEGSSMGEPVGTVTAAIPGSNTMIFYSIVTSVVRMYFSISMTTGEILVAGDIDREMQEVLNFNVQALAVIGSGQMLRTLVTVTVTILDINDERPFFDQVIYSGQVLENQPPGTTVVRRGSDSFGLNYVTATDNDLGENGTIDYMIVGGDDVPFTVNMNGEIRTTVMLNREGEQSRFQFFVSATDRGNPPMTSLERVIVFIDITDLNDNPPVFNASVYHASVREEASVDDEVVVVLASDDDLDENAQITYSLHGSSDFAINALTGAVRVAAMLDHERQAFYNLTVDGYDGANRASTSLQISVSDVNDEPPAFNATIYTTAVEENSDISSPLLRVFATDVDLVGNVSFFLLSGPSRDNFTINSTSGEVFLSYVPDYESAQQLVVQVAASDGVHETLAPVSVQIVDKNDVYPMFDNATLQGSVLENRAAGMNVVKVSARDTDSGVGGLLQYEIVGGDAGSRTNVNVNQLPFQIGLQSGLIVTTDRLNREEVEFYTLYVRASDLGSPSLSSTGIVHVTVSDDNDHPPVFDNSVYSTTVSESVDINFLVLTVRATDADSGANAQISYELKSGNNRENFAMDTQSGNITVRKELDFETEQFFNLTVIARDGGLVSMEGSATVLIQILDENDNRPVFWQKTFVRFFPEGTPVGSMVEQVHATDIDVNGPPVLYEIAEEDRAPQFQVNSETGVLTLAAELDYELETQHRVRIWAYNEGDEMLRDTATVTVYVQDVNDEVPIFSPPSAEYFVTENVQPPSFLGVVSATDRDTVTEPSDITYRLQRSTYSNRFRLDERTGVFETMATFDREEVALYRLIITADDGGSPSQTGTTTVTVTIGDVNDNVPKPGHADVFIYLTGGHFSSIIVGQVNANDPDIVNNHMYSLLSEAGNNMGPFSLHLGNGSIQAPDNPPVGRYSFTVNVTENRNWARCTVAVHVSEISPSVAENSIIIRISQITAQNFLQNKLSPFSSVDVFRSVVQSSLQPFIVSVQDVIDAEELVDVSFSLETGGGSFVSQELLRHLVHSNRDSFSSQEVGIRVETELLDLCASEPCGQNGICENVLKEISPQVVSHSPPHTIVTSAPVWDYKCTCLQGSSGRSCEQGTVDYCAYSPCMSPMVCVSLPSEGHATCECPPGSYLERGICVVNQTSCSNLGCLNDASCAVVEGGLACACTPDFVGPKCQIRKVDPSSICTFYGCENNSTCTASHAGTTCTCVPGFSGIQCTKKIPSSGVRDCSVNPCMYGGTCQPEISGSSYTCVCAEGYSGKDCEVDLYNGVTAPAPSACDTQSCGSSEDCIIDLSGSAKCVDFCSPNPCSNSGTCIRQKPGFACNCKSGYFGSRCEVALGSFQLRGYSFFPSLNAPLNDTIYLEFATESKYGLIFLNGRYDDEFSDFIVLELLQGILKYTVSRGGERSDLEFTDRDLGDKRWHSVVAGYNLTVSPCVYMCV